MTIAVQRFLTQNLIYTLESEIGPLGSIASDGMGLVHLGLNGTVSNNATLLIISGIDQLVHDPSHAELLIDADYQTSLTLTCPCSKPPKPSPTPKL
jgi:hypothetical protein